MISARDWRAFSARAALLLVPMMTGCAVAAGKIPGIETDRPDLTEGVATVPNGTAQLEGGYTHTRSGGQKENAIGEVLLRVATSPRSEFRLALNSYDVNSAGRSWDRGFEDAAVGMKFRVLERADDARGLLPSISVLAATTLPTGSGGTGTGKFLPEAKLATSWALSDRVSLGGNLIASQELLGTSRIKQGGASLSLGTDLTERLGSYVEWYAFRPFVAGEKAEHYLNGGLTFGITDDFQLDARFGGSLYGEHEHFFGIGIARRWRR